MDVPQEVAVAVPPPTPLVAPSTSFQESYDVEFKDITYTVTSGFLKRTRTCQSELFVFVETEALLTEERRVAPSSGALARAAASNAGFVDTASATLSHNTRPQTTFVCCVSVGMTSGAVHEAALVTDERKCLLHGVSGLFRAGELSVVVGVSGAGKSTLMDILSGYTASCSGSVWIGGMERAPGRRACYILQDSALQGALTAAEALRVAADLKLPRSADKHLRVEEILLALGLSKCRHTRIASLSGGQRKRLAIGVELTSDPPIMFLDEPTSGLDSSTTKHLVSLLRSLARQGRTLVVTMHQPSTPVLQMIDRLYAISAGRCVYQGAVSQLIPFLNAHDLPCPSYHNPVDVLMEVCSGATGTNLADSLSETCRNCHNDRWINPLPMSAVVKKIDTPFFNDSINGINGLAHRPESQITKGRQRLHRYPTSFWNQLSVLFFRSIKLVIRDPVLSGMNIFIHCTIGFLIGLLYYNIGRDAQNILNNFHYMVFSVMFVMFTSFSAVSIKFPCEVPVLRREHFNRWYSTRAYYIASLAAFVPMHTVCAVLYSAISYWLTGQPWQASRAISFAGILILVSLIAMGFGLMNGAMFSVQNGAIFGSFTLMPFVIFCGLFLRYSDAPPKLRWLFSASFMKHGVVGVSLAIFGEGRARLDCTAEYCHYVYPSLFLKDFDMGDTEYYQTVIALVGFLGCVMTLTYFILNFKLKHKG